MRSLTYSNLTITDADGRTLSGVQADLGVVDDPPREVEPVAWTCRAEGVALTPLTAFLAADEQHEEARVDLTFPAIHVRGMSPHVRRVYLGHGGNARQRRTRRRAAARHRVLASVQNGRAVFSVPEPGRLSIEVGPAPVTFSVVAVGE